MGKYKNVKHLRTEKVTEKKGIIMPTKKLKFFGGLFCIMLTFATLGLSVLSLGFSSEIRRITASWSPNLQDIGKLKFVDGGQMSEEEVAALSGEMAMPFDYSYVSEIGAGSFLVSGLGSVVVKSCLDGKVAKVESSGDKKIITISHGRGLSSVYESIDTVGVKQGDKVKKNTAIGVSLSSEIVLKVLLGGKVIAGLTVKDGEMTFS